MTKKTDEFVIKKFRNFLWDMNDEEFAKFTAQQLYMKTHGSFKKKKR